MKQIGNIVREKRKSIGLSMEKVSQKAGVSYRTILAIEQGRQVTTSTLLVVLKALGLEILIKDKEEALT
jgi:transcriptional regulator with XRE-family HTH domain